MPFEFHCRTDLENIGDTLIVLDEENNPIATYVYQGMGKTLRVLARKSPVEPTITVLGDVVHQKIGNHIGARRELIFQGSGGRTFTSGYWVVVDEENNAEQWWDTLATRWPKLWATLRDAVRPIRLSPKQFNALCDIPGWDAGPQHARHPLVGVNPADYDLTW